MTEKTGLVWQKARPIWHMFCLFQRETHFNLTQLAYQLYLLSPDAYGLVISLHNCQCDESVYYCRIESH